MPSWINNINLSEKSNLSSEESNEIASILHALLVNEFFANKKWTTNNAVFHGGTALALLYNSGRFSEDLDFMVSEEVMDALEKAMKLAHSKVNAVIQSIFPGSKLELSGPRGQSVESWIFGWTHPNRRGKVKVKVEFLRTPVDILQHYKTSRGLLNGDHAELRSLLSPVIGPEYVSSWADKIMAMANRPEFKWRDVYDMAFLKKRLDNNDVSQEEKIEALANGVNIYGYSLEQIRDGLQDKIDKGTFDRVADYIEDMKDWIPEQTWKGWTGASLFDQHMREVLKEVEKAIVSINEHTTSIGMKI